MLIIRFACKVNQLSAWNNRFAMRWQLVAAGGREWRYPLNPLRLFQVSVMQRKAKSGIIRPLHTCVAAFGVGVVACGVLRIPILLERSFICFTPSHALKSVPTIPIKPLKILMPFLAQWQNDAARTVPTMRKVQNQTLLPQSAHSFDSLQYRRFLCNR